LTDLVLGAVREFQIDCSQLHNDSTSVVLHGDYTAADGHERGGKSTAVAARGHSNECRRQCASSYRGVSNSSGLPGFAWI
jgi:hypothetical protein